MGRLITPLEWDFPISPRQCLDVNYVTIILTLHLLYSSEVLPLVAEGTTVELPSLHGSDINVADMVLYKASHHASPHSILSMRWSNWRNTALLLRSLNMFRSAPCILRDEVDTIRAITQSFTSASLVRANSEFSHIWVKTILSNPKCVRGMTQGMLFLASLTESLSRYLPLLKVMVSSSLCQRSVNENPFYR